jgi:MFS family permease
VTDVTGVAISKGFHLFPPRFSPFSEGIATPVCGLARNDTVYKQLHKLPIYTSKSNIWVISAAISIEQFGYGFGFTAYMLYMMFFSEGKSKTSHYSICTAFMAMSMLIPGMFAGYIQEALGYVDFFWMVMACCLATFIVTFFAYRKLDPNYGKK